MLFTLVPMSVHYRNWILGYKQIAHRWARHRKSSKHVFIAGSTIDSTNMLLTMIHGQAFWRLTWKPPSRGNSYPLVVMCWTKDEQCLGKTQITHLSNSRAPLSILIDVRSIVSTCCVYLLNHMLFFSFYLL